MRVDSDHGYLHKINTPCFPKPNVPVSDCQGLGIRQDRLCFIILFQDVLSWCIGQLQNEGICSHSQRVCVCVWVEERKNFNRTLFWPLDKPAGTSQRWFPIILSAQPPSPSYSVLKKRALKFPMYTIQETHSKHTNRATCAWHNSSPTSSKMSCNPELCICRLQITTYHQVIPTYQHCKACLHHMH